jgi:uroporphyrinogen-III synthase
MAESLDPKNGPVLHVRGEDVAFDMTAALRSAGFEAEAIVTYRAKTIARLEPDQLAAAARSRGAEAGARLMAPLAPHLVAICISEAAQAAAQGAPFAAFAVAERPTDEALIATAFAQTEAKG